MAGRNGRNAGRIVALVAGLALALGLMPSMALAAGGQDGQLATAQGGVGAITTASTVNSGEFGYDGDNLKWELADDGTLTISGKGAMGDCSGSSRPWDSLRNDIKSVVIETGVTSVGAGAFEQCKNLQSVEIPVGVTSVGESAFQGCQSLARVAMPSTVASVGGYAFASCDSLVRAGGVVGDFYYGGTLSQWDSLFSSEINTGIAASTTPAYHPNVVVSVSVSPTDAAGMVEGGVGYSFETGTWMFAATATPAEGYRLVDWSKDGETVGAYRKCSFTVEDSCTVTANFEAGLGGVCGDNLTWTLEDGTLAITGTGAMDDYSYSPDPVMGTSPWFSYAGAITRVDIGNGVTSIGGCAFAGCVSLASIDLPSCVTSIGMGAFKDCTSLAAIKIPSSVESIGDYAFATCTSLASIEIPSGVTSIGRGTFAVCSSLASIEIPSGVTSIGYGAFASCTSLASIEIPSGVTSIGSGAFEECASLTSIEIPSGVTSLEYATFKACTSLTSIEISLGVESIGSWAFAGCSSLASIELPSGVTYIGNQAFGGCHALQRVAIPDSVTCIDEGVFNECSALETVRYDGTLAQWNDPSFVKKDEWDYGVPDGVVLSCRYVGEAEAVPREGGTAEAREETLLKDPQGSWLTATAEANTGYDFAGWTGEGADFVDPAATTTKFTVGSGLPTITANFKLKKYTISWKQDDGTLIDETAVEHGSMPAHADPAKPADSQYTYTFRGWTPEVAAATGDATYTAAYDKTVNKYTVKFVNYDGKALQTSEVAYGQVPKYAGKAPAKPADSKYTYEFRSWSPAVRAVAGDATYTAVYKAVPRKYTVRFVNYDGKALQVSKVAYGKVPKYSGKAPTKAADSKYAYTFRGWTPKVSKVTGNATYRAAYAAKRRPGAPVVRMAAKGKDGLSVSWEKVKGAAGYDVFFSMCDHDGQEVVPARVATVKAGGALSWSTSGLEPKTAYKALVKAYVVKGGKKRYIGSSPLMHLFTSGGTGSYTNAGAVEVNKAKVSLERGRSFQLEARVSKGGDPREVMPGSHVARVRYRSTDASIAAVTAKGKIKAKGKGACYVYAYAHNGVYKRVKVTVK